MINKKIIKIKKLLYDKGGQNYSFKLVNKILLNKKNPNLHKFSDNNDEEHISQKHQKMLVILKNMRDLIR